MRVTLDLPEWPSRGNRRRIEEQWLAQLEREGLSAFLPEPPAVSAPQLHKAVQEFNSRAFWECHETLEEVWLVTPYPLRFFYHCIIKVAVGFHHMSRHNRHGARVKLSDGVRLLHIFLPEYMGVDTGRLLDDASWWMAHVASEDRVDWRALDALSTPVIHLVGRLEPPMARGG